MFNVTLSCLLSLSGRTVNHTKKWKVKTSRNTISTDIVEVGYYYEIHTHPLWPWVYWVFSFPQCCIIALSCFLTQFFPVLSSLFSSIIEIFKSLWIMHNVAKHKAHTPSLLFKLQRSLLWTIKKSWWHHELRKQKYLSSLAPYCKFNLALSLCDRVTHVYEKAFLSPWNTKAGISTSA